MPIRSVEGIICVLFLYLIKSFIIFLLSLSWFALLQAAAIITLLFIIAINLAIGILPHADNFAHVGGFASGFLLGFVLLARPQFGWMERHELPQTNQPPKYKPYQYVLWVVALVLMIAG
jgi:membrane associated rhomboid family serine protease